MTIAKNYDDNMSGAVNTKLAQGDLVKAPFRSTVRLLTSGSATAAFLQQGTGTNPDGSSSSVSLFANAGTGNLAVLRETLFGRVVGVRWRRDGNAALVPAPFTVIIDGVAHAVRNTGAKWHTTTDSQMVDHEALAVFSKADLIGDGPHSVEVHLSGDPTTGANATRQLQMYGWVLEQSKGYRTPVPLATFPSAMTAIPTTATAITGNLGATRKIHFVNTDTTLAHVVTLYYPGSNTQPFKKFLLPAATGTNIPTAEYDLGQPVMMSQGTSPIWYWSLDVAPGNGNVFGALQQGDAR